MKNFSIIKYIYISFLLIGIFFSVVTSIKLIYHYLPNMSMLGEQEETLGFYSFWADILASIASFTMVFITSVSVNLNGKQLTELKRQWKEEHSPYLSCQLVPNNNHFSIRIFNSGNVTAHDVKIEIISNLSKEPFRFKNLQEYLKDHSFVIPPNESVYLYLGITLFKEIEHLPSGNLVVSLSTSEAKFERYKLVPQNYAFTDNPADSLRDCIYNGMEKLSREIKDKKFLFK